MALTPFQLELLTDLALPSLKRKWIEKLPSAAQALPSQRIKVIKIIY
jgi:hypothetical protein